ncbi:MAG: hypothetical protein V8S12_03960 [Lachnospiraceae bacterium]
MAAACILSPAAALLFLAGFVLVLHFHLSQSLRISLPVSAFAAFSASPLALLLSHSSSSIRFTSWLFFSVENFSAPAPLQCPLTLLQTTTRIFSLIIKRCSLSFCVLHHSVMNLFYLSYFNFYSDFWFDFLILGILPAKIFISAAISL